MEEEDFRFLSNTDKNNLRDFLDYLGQKNIKPLLVGSASTRKYYKGINLVVRAPMEVIQILENDLTSGNSGLDKYHTHKKRFSGLYPVDEEYFLRRDRTRIDLSLRIKHE